MKQTLLFLAFCFTSSTYFANAQEYAVDKRASLLSGTLGFSSQGGQLYTGSSGRRINTFILTPSFSQFVAKNFFAGASLEFTYQSVGSYSSNSIAVGPHLGAAAGNVNSTAFPYFLIGIRFYQSSNEYFNFSGDNDFTGTDMIVNAGIIAKLKSHLGMTIEASFHALNLKNSYESISGNVFSIGIGITGLLYKGEAKKPVPDNKK